MPITVNYLATPQNVQAQLQSGGSLLPNTTYYVRVAAKNYTNRYMALVGDLESRASVEISFTTDSVNLSALITWDSVSGASCYDVFMSKISDNFQDSGYDRGTKLGTLGSNYTTLTNSFLITLDNTHQSGSSAAHPIGEYNDGVYSFGLYPGGLVTKNLGLICVQLSGDCGKTYLYDIYQAIVNAGFSDHVFIDSKNTSFFSLCGSILINTGTKGYIVNYASSGSTDCGLWGVTFWIYIAIKNLSTDFNWSFGRKTNNYNAGTYQSKYYLGAYQPPMQNLKFYGGSVDGSKSVTFRRQLGRLELDSGVNQSLFYDMKFLHLGVTNYHTAFNYNTVQAYSLNRMWGLNHLYGVTVEAYTSFSIYPPNGIITFHDSILRLRHLIAYDFSVTGYNSRDYSNSIVYFYDTILTDRITSWNNVIISWGHAGGLLPPLKIYFSLNITVKDKNGNGLDGATMTVKDKDNNIVVSNLVSANGGVFPKTDLLFYKFQSTGIDGTGDSYTIKNQYFPFTITITCNSFQNYEFVFNEEKKIEQTVILTRNIIEISSLSFTHPTLAGNDGTITVQATGGLAPYQFSIDGGENWQSSGEFTGLPQGTYQIVVKDAEDTEVSGMEVELKAPQYYSDFIEATLTETALGAVLEEDEVLEGSISGDITLTS